MAGGGEAKGTPSLRWPTPSDLNTRLRRIIAGYQRVVKKAELKKAAAEKASSNEKKMTLEKVIRHEYWVLARKLTQSF